MAAVDPVLVIGAGFLGTHVAGGLAAAGHEVTLLSRSATARIPGVVHVRGDAADRAVVSDALGDGDTVVHCAGGRPPAESDLDPLADLHATLPPLLSVLDVLRQREHGRVLAMSSGGAVYGEATVLPVPEDHPLAPTSSYGILKATCERYLALYARHFGVRATALRCGNVYGPGQRPFRSQGVIASLLACASTGRPLTVYGDGTTVRDYIHVSDVVAAVAALVRLDASPPAVNVGTGRGASVAELIGIVEGLVGRPLELVYEPARPSDLRQIVLDVSLLRTLTGLDTIALEEGIARTWSGVADVVRPRE